jgi:transposase-like protein
MAGHGSKIRKKEQAVAALLACGTIDEAARAVGISPATLLRWTKDPDFAKEYAEARRAAVAQAIGTIQHLTLVATATLRVVMEDADAPASARVSASKTVLETAIDAIELQDIQDRLAALERLVKGTANEQ